MKLKLQTLAGNHQFHYLTGNHKMFNVTVNKHRQQIVTLSQQMFTITAARSNTHLKSFAPLIDCSVYPALLQLFPHCHDALLQLVDVLTRLPIDSLLRKLV